MGGKEVDATMATNVQRRDLCACVCVHGRAATTITNAITEELDRFAF